MCICRYVEVRAPGVICFFKDRATALANPSTSTTTSAPPPGAIQTVHLPLITDFSIVQKAGRELVHLDLVLTEDVIKLRFTNLEEAERWKGLLIQWKDYAVDYGTYISVLHMRLHVICFRRVCLMCTTTYYVCVIVIVNYSQLLPLDLLIC
jgi:hypothetical protein